GKAVALARRAPAALRSSTILDVLPVLYYISQQTYTDTLAAIRGAGCALPEGNASTAVNRFCAQVTRAFRTKDGWRPDNKGRPDATNSDNVACLLHHARVKVRFNVWIQQLEYSTKEGEWSLFDDAELNRLRAIGSSEYEYKP